MRRLIGIGIVVIIFLGCAAKSEYDELQPIEPETTVRVINNKPIEMKIYALDGSTRIKLGTVSGSEERVFVIPPFLIRGGNSLQFMADPIGSNLTATTQWFPLRPGEEIQFTIM